MRYQFTLLVIMCLFLVNVQGQAPEKPTSADIYHSIQKLNFLGSALYIAAHPDDENTRLISYLSNGVKARTGYLSITRGDGGQNLIGPELKELLGVLRTQELLGARSIDGGEQFFTRAVDFGYSKHPDETLRIWNKEEVLGDVVRVIRQFKPDVIVNRFNHRTPGSTHGQHTSSAMLSTEAFDLVGSDKAYPSQLETLDTWQPRRLFFNTSWWFYGSQENFEKADKSNLISVDSGVYYPILGLSNNELASMASSQHKCQGFGRLTTRGSETEYLEIIKGDLPQGDQKIFEGIDTSWSRINGGDKIGEILYAVENNFNFTKPSVHLKDLIKAYGLLQGVEDAHWKVIKSEELKALIASVSGLYLEVATNTPVTVPGSEVSVKVEALNRSDIPIQLKSIQINNKLIEAPALVLENNKKETLDLQVSIPANASFTSPYWLNKKGTLGMYSVEDTYLIGKPEAPEAHSAQFELDIDGTSISLERPLVYRYSEPDQGELYRPFEVLPAVTCSFEDNVVIFSNGSTRNIPVRIRAEKDSINGSISLVVSDNWKVANNQQEFSISKKGEEITLNFEVIPPMNQDELWAKAMVSVGEKKYSSELITIAYDHIQTQSVLLPAESKFVRLNIDNYSEAIGYIEGAGDGVAESLVQMGCRVEEIKPESIQLNSLTKYDAVVLGIRAYNVHDVLKLKQPALMDYVKNGGTMIVQYNTAGRWDSAYKEIAPYPLQLSRDRVTDENSKVDIIAPEHPLITHPNAISLKDFEGWVQERGLYFPKEWDPSFTAILSMQDEGYDATKGSLLVAPFGKGYYIYTGLSFFRELPAGVSGAYKLFANMLSIGKADPEETHDTKG
ncbi:MAG: PIG-L family deacetylase [Flavobacteriaceae bacterium]|nr:PIG-L family deacetylase [Flavobacteriaceae bacterium]